MLVVLTETYCNKVNIQITQRDVFIQIAYSPVHGLLYKNTAAEYAVCKEKSLHNFSAVVRLTVKLSFLSDKTRSKHFLSRL